ncbi:unnamed protein product [Symbiodinium sp. CCMP2592]|nr:unnamed protein product [Symbiodinium sp. CCMP2592]
MPLCGLIIDHCWIKLILAGTKCWEIRGGDTDKRGRIGLCKGGLCYGTAVLSDSLEITGNMSDHADKHQVQDPALWQRYQRRFAYVLCNPHTFAEPLKYSSKARVWVRLSNAEPVTAAEPIAIESEISEPVLTELQTTAELQVEAKRFGIKRNLARRKFTVVDAELEITETFSFLPTLESQRDALVRARAFQVSMQGLAGEAMLMQKGALVKFLSEAGQKTTGAVAKLRQRWVQHKLRELQAPTAGATTAAPSTAAPATLASDSTGAVEGAPASASDTGAAEGVPAAHAFQIFSVEQALQIVVEKDKSAHPSLKDEAYVVPHQLILKFQQARQQNRMQDHVGLLFTESTKYRKRARKVLKMCFWVPEMDWRETSKLTDTVQGVKAECDLVFSGLVAFRDSQHRSNVEWVQRLQGLLSEEVLMLEIGTDGTNSTVYVFQDTEEGDKFVEVSSYGAAAGKFNRVQVGHSGQLDSQDLQVMVSRVMSSPSILVADSATDQGPEAILDLLWAAVSRKNKPIRTSALFQLCVPSKPLSALLRKHGYHATPSMPVDFDHSGLLEDLSLMSGRRREELRQVCLASLSSPDADKPWTEVTTVKCREKGLPNLVAMAEKRGHQVAQPLELAMALGGMTEAMVQFTKEAESASTKKRGRPYATIDDRKRAKIVSHVRQCSYLSREMRARALERLKRKRPEPEASDGGTEAEQKKTRRDVVSGVHSIAPASEVEAGLEFERRGFASSVDKHLEAKFPGKYCSRRYFHWKTLYHKWCWGSIPSKDAARWRQVPNSWKRGFANHKDNLRGVCADKHGLPPAVDDMVHEQLQALTCSDRLFSRAEPVSRKDVTHTITSVVNTVNAVASQKSTEATRFNLQLTDQFCKEEISFDEYAAKLQALPRTVPLKSMEWLAKDFLKRSDFTKQAVNTSGTYLEEDDPRMVALPVVIHLCEYGLHGGVSFVNHYWRNAGKGLVEHRCCCQGSVLPGHATAGATHLRSRAAHEKLREQHNIPLALILNYDQTWFQPFRAPKGIIMKKQTKRARSAVTRISSITGARTGLTFVTTSFATGEVGPVFVNLAPGTLSKKDTESLVSEFEDTAVIMTSKTPSHFMNAEATWNMFETLLTKAFAKQRDKYHLWGRCGLLLADAFGGNHAAAFALLRKKWSEVNSVMLPQVQPGGWSAHGQPQDQIHGFFKDMCDQSVRGSLKFSKNLFCRLEINCTGQVRREADCKSAIRSGIKNWQLIPAAMVQNAWVKTGYATWDEIEAVTTGNREMARAMQQQEDPHGFADVLGKEGAAAPTAEEVHARLVHEKAVVWQVKCPADENWSYLPQARVMSLLALVLIVEKQLCLYLHQRAIAKPGQPVQHMCSVVWSLRARNEMRHDWVAKYTDLVDGKRVLSEKCKRPSLYSIFHVDLLNLLLFIGSEQVGRKLAYSLVPASDVSSASDVEWLSVQKIHEIFAKQSATTGATGRSGQKVANVEGDPAQDNEGNHEDDEESENENGKDDDQEPDEFQNMMVAYEGDQALHGGGQPVRRLVVDSKRHKYFVLREDDTVLAETDTEHDQPPEEVGDADMWVEGAAPLVNLRIAGSHVPEPEPDVTRFVTKSGKYTTPGLERLRNLLPPRDKCRVQQRAPDGVVQAWFPGVPSKTFRFSEASVWTNETLPAIIVDAALRNAIEWLWVQFGHEVGAERAQEMFRAVKARVDAMEGGSA